MTGAIGPSTVADLFKMSLQAEETGLRFYRRMSLEFAHVPDVAAVWAEMMEDETLHVRALHNLAARLSLEDLAQPVAPVQASRAANILNILSDRRIEHVGNLDDAYELAREYEASELNRLFTFLMTKDINLKGKHGILRREIGHHQAKLDGIVRHAGRSDARRAILPVAPARLG